MLKNEVVTRQQLVIIRQLCEDTRTDIGLVRLDFESEEVRQNIPKLIELGLVEQNDTQTYLSTKVLRLLAESNLLPDKDESRAAEIVRMHEKTLKLEKFKDEVEKLNSRSDISNDEKVKQTLGLVRLQDLEPTF